MKKNTYLVSLFFCLFQLGFSQNLSQYTFSQSNSGFTAISGGTALGSTTTDDQRFLDPTVPLGSTSYTGVGLPIGFNFTYNGYVYDRFAINANGWISLGSSLLTPSVDMNSTTSYAPISSTSTTVSNTLVARISAFTRDLMSQAGGEIRYELTGTSPNQVLVVQWKNYAKYLATGDSYTFQIKLHQTSNVVDIVYGTMTNNATSTTADCGLRANPNNPATNFSSRTTATDWFGTTASTSATDTVLLSSTIFPASGLTYSWTPPPSCSGTPNPGNTISSTTSICNGVGFTLSLQNNISGSGVTYQWQTSSNGVTYVNASGTSTDPTYSASQTTATYYQCIVTCTASGLNATSTPVMVGMNSVTNCYCIPTTVYGCGDGDVIARVILNTLDNNSGTGCPSDPVPGNQGAGQNGPGYSDYTGNTSLTTILQAGSTYNCTVYAGQYTEGYAAWIDYNDDGIFDNATERIGYSNGQVTGSGSVGVLGSSATFSIVLACNPSLGVHRLRVRGMFNTDGSSITPCTGNSYGEVEDYNITISAAVACPQPSALNVTNITGTAATLGWTAGCAETSWNVYLTTTGGSTPTTPTYSNTVNPLAVTGLTPGTSYDFYVSADCQTNGTSLWTGPFTFTTSPVNDNCSGAVSLTIGNVFADNAVTGYNNAASNSNAPAPGCASFSGGDVWYAVTVPVSGSVTIETNPASGSPITDTGMAAYSGTCGSLSLISCDDDGSASGNFSQISLTGRTPGEVIYFNVWEYGNDTFGTFQVSAYDCPSTTPAPTGDAVQIFCSAATVGDLYVDGSSIQWYATATGGTALNLTDDLVDGTTYYASQTLACESYNRFAVTVTISSYPVVNSATQIGCDPDADGSATFDLTASNAAVTSETSVTYTYYVDYFEAGSGVNPIVNPTAFIGTNNQIIYVKVANSNGCSSIAELTLNTTTTLAPTGAAAQTFCGAGTLADLVVTGSSIIWYDAATSGNLLLSSTTLVDGTTYYASQTNNGCESEPRLAITVTENCPFAGCLTDTFGQYPPDTFTPACIGTAQAISPYCYAGEYSLVNVTSGVTYTFSSSVATDVITIGDGSGSTVYTFGTGSVTWTATVSDVVRFYTHLDTNCTDESVGRTRAVQCGTVPPTPVNDDCAGATVLTPGGVFSDYPLVGTNLGATASAGVSDPICSSYQGGDVWYSVTVPASGSITFETQIDGTGAITDTGIEAFSGACGSLTSIGCNDDTSNDTFSILSLTSLTPGSIVYLRVFDYDNAEFGTFQVSAYDGSLATNTFDNSKFSYYPNPVKDVLNLSYSQNISKLQVMNILGQEVMAKSVNANQSQIDMSNLPSGTYLVKVTSDNQVKTIKVIKE